jgi:hypothetical protein
MVADMMDNDAQDHLTYYVKTEDPAPAVRKAMRDYRIVNGMDTTEVKLVMDAHPEWTEGPQDERTTETGTRLWIYRQKGPGRAEYRVEHRDGIVVRHSLPLGERP